jgi:osmoprotectant transport system ATP-binding protein
MRSPEGGPHRLILLEDVTKQFPDGTVAVDRLTMEMASDQITVLLGSSGCGKTTTLRMVNRLVEPTSGRISLDGVDVTTLPVTELRRGIGYVLQHAGLFPHRTVADNIATVPKLLGWDSARAKRRSMELLELVGIPESVAKRYPGQLSGGQQQRVGVARALAADPPVLLMDEPFGAVDPVMRGQLQREFLRLQRELKKTVVFVTHDVDEAVMLGDKIALFREGGRIAQYDTPAEVLARPADDFVASFLGGTRGLKLLSLRAAGDVAFSPVPTRSADGGSLDLPGAPLDTGGWEVRLDEDSRPQAWVRVGAIDAAVPLVAVGPTGSVRDLLDSAVASPCRVAVRTGEDGALLGGVSFDEIGVTLDRFAERSGP